MSAVDLPGRRLGVGDHAEVGVDDRHHVLGRPTDGALADLGAHLATAAAIQLLQRDVPQLLGVDEGAVHVPQHRAHAAHCVIAGRCHPNPVAGVTR
jgi:hypothetical protein